MFGFGKKNAEKKAAAQAPNIDPIEELVYYPKNATEEEKAKIRMYAELLYKGTQDMKKLGLDDIVFHEPKD